MKLNGKKGKTKALLPRVVLLSWLCRRDALLTRREPAQEALKARVITRGKTLDCLRRLYPAAITRTKWVRYFPQSWLAQGFSANRSRGGTQFVIQCGQWQHSALREF
jgi:hypothetical protein